MKRFYKVLVIGSLIAGGCADDNPATPDPLAGIADERAQYRVSTLTTSFPGSGGLTVDKEGFIYVANFGDFINDANGEEVSRVDPGTGEVTVFATGLIGPSGNVFAENGDLYQANIAGNTISKITPEGEVSLFASRSLGSPVGVTFDADGNLYACNCGFGTISKYEPDGTSSRFVVNALLKCPNGLTIDEQGNLYAANFNNGDVIKITPDGSPEVLATLPGDNNAHLVYHDGVIYVLGRRDNRLYRLSLEGEVTVIAGTGESGNEDGSGEEASFYIPNGIGISPDGSKIYVISRVFGEGPPLNPVLVRVVERN